MLNNRQKGKAGEEYAKQAYLNQGYELVAQNFYCRFGEIDLIVKNETFFVFCEVKLRRGNYFGSSLQAVTQRKIGKIIKSAQQYLLENPTCLHLQPRFDVFGVQIAQKDDKLLVESTELIENAFGVDEIHV